MQIETKMKINIKTQFSIAFESRRIFHTLRKLDWFNKNGYSINLPKGIRPTDRRFNQRHIKEAVLEDYKMSEYEKIGKDIKNKWGKLTDKLTKGLATIDLKPKSLYKVYLTKYGVGGSYNLPNIIIVNFSSKTTSEVLKTIIHEIIHLLIEPLIVKFKIDHWSKERIVDLILSKTSPVSVKLQKLSINTKKIDKIFNKFYPDIESIIQSIK